MNGYALIANFLWAGVTVFSVLVAAFTVDRWFDLQQPQGEQPEDVKVPDDLTAFAMGEDAEWAQQQTMKVIRERYALFGNWNQVRAALGVATRDE